MYSKLYIIHILVFSGVQLQQMKSHVPVRHQAHSTPQDACHLHKTALSSQHLPRPFLRALSPCSTLLSWWHALLCWSSWWRPLWCRRHAWFLEHFLQAANIMPVLKAAFLLPAVSFNATTHMCVLSQNSNTTCQFSFKMGTGLIENGEVGV